MDLKKVETKMPKKIIQDGERRSGTAMEVHPQKREFQRQGSNECCTEVKESFLEFMVGMYFQV